MKISTLASLALTTAVVGQAHANTHTFQTLSSSAHFAAATNLFDGHAGAVVENNDGTFHLFEFDGANTWSHLSTLPDSAAVAGQGVTAVTDGAAVYVFEVENAGLYVIKLHSNYAWDNHWCLVGGVRPDLRGRPAAVWLGGSNGFQIAVHTSSDRLAVFHVAPTDNDMTCGAAQAVANVPGNLSAPPVIVSFGPNRYDVFGRDTSGLMRHWWANDGFMAPQNENSFRMENGQNQQFNVSAAVSSIAAVPHGMAQSPPQSMIVWFRGSNDDIQELSYDSRFGFFTQVLTHAPGSIVDISVHTELGYAAPIVCTTAQCTAYDPFGQIAYFPYLITSGRTSPQSIHGVNDLHGTPQHLELLVATGGLFWANDTGLE